MNATSDIRLTESPDSAAVTTERRPPGARIQMGDHVRDMSGMYRTGIVKSIAGFCACVQWTDGPEETLAIGFLERVPAAVAT